MIQPADLEFMRLAISEAKRSIHKEGRIHPQVGAVVTSEGRLLASACHGDLGAPCDHAEFSLLEKSLKNHSVAGCTLYTTLEPCTTRNHPKYPCAGHIVERQISRVFIGMLDPNQAITGKGILQLRKARIAVQLFPPELMAEAEELNRHFAREQAAQAAIVGGTTISGTQYDLFSLFDRDARDCVIVAQNLRTLIGPRFLEHMKLTLERGATIVMILTTLEAISAISDVARDHYIQTIRDLTQFVGGLSREQRERFRICFHPRATSLSATVRRDKHRERIIFAPRFATDTDADNRVFCVVDRRDNREIYDRLIGHLSYMMQPGAQTLESIAGRLGIQ